MTTWTCGGGKDCRARIVTGWWRIRPAARPQTTRGPEPQGVSRWLATLPPTSGSACGWRAAPAFCDFGSVFANVLLGLPPAASVQVFGRRRDDIPSRPAASAAAGVFGDAMNIKIRDLYEQRESKITGLRVGDCVRRPNGAELRIVAHGPGHNTVSSIYTSTWRGSQSTARDGRGFFDDLLPQQVHDLCLMDAEIIEAAPRGFSLLGRTT